MNTKLTLKNFRVFDNKQGGTFNLAPITILTGCNSSGKSSLVKSLLLLKDFFLELSSNKITDCKLNFGNTLAKLGRFDLALNDKSRKNGKMYFAYTVYSKRLREELQVELWFTSDPEDRLNNGWLNRFTISRMHKKAVIIDAIISKTERDELDLADAYMVINKLDLRPILNNFIKTVYSDLLCERIGGVSYMRKEDRQEIIKEINDVFAKKLSRILSKDQKDELSNDLDWMMVNGVNYDSIYNWHLYTDLSIPNIIFPLPILSLLEDVSKNEICKRIYTLLAEVKDKEFKYYNFLEQVLSQFEMSKYNNFLEYYHAMEIEGLRFRKFEVPISDTAFGLGKAKFVHRINSFGTLLDFNNKNMQSGCIQGNEYIDEFTGTKFSELYSVMAEVSKFIDADATKQYVLEHWNTNLDGYDEHKVLTDLCKYFDDIVIAALSPIQYKGFQYVGDSAIEIKHIYTLDNKDEVGCFIAKYCAAIRLGKQGKFTPGEFVNKWVKAFGVGERVYVDYVNEGYGISVRLFKNAQDKIGRLLVDEGFGITKLIVTLINIELAILSKHKNEVITLAIEEPENHLHPRYQSLLAEMFADAYKNYGIHFIVETHSEYMVRKLQTLVAKKELTPAEVSLQYLYNPDIELRPKGEPQVKDIPIGEDGILKDTFGSGFMDEADNLAMDILTIKAMS